jgi:hypothetical protein
VVKVGFICEGESEKIIVESSAFQDLLKRLQIECILPVIDAKGNGNLLPKNIQIHLNTLKTAGAEKFMILTDLDKDTCITLTKDRITHIEDAVIIVAVKQLEAWYLADNKTMSTMLKKNHEESDPEISDNPIKTLSQLCNDNIGRGLGNDKPFIAKKILKAGFTIENAAQHPKCYSAQYFLNKLREISTLN